MRRANLAVLTGLILLVPIIAEGSSVAAPEQQASLLSQNVDSCLVDMTGDVNLSGTITSADIIYVVNFIFITGPSPQPCTGAGDVNCSGSVTAADVIGLVNYVFKSGPEPCDICSSEFGFVQNCIQ